MLVRVCIVLAVVCIMPATALIGIQRSCSCSRSMARQWSRVDILSAATADSAAVSGSVSGPDTDNSNTPCFWYEDPAETQRGIPAPFGRAQKGVEERLQKLNWQQLHLDSRRALSSCHEEKQQKQRLVPSFTFKYPGAPTFCAYHPGIPGLIRQIPTSWDWDKHIDDKLHLHLLLSSNSTITYHNMTMMPPTFVVDHALLASLEGGQDNENQGGTDDGCNDKDHWHWFLKHRLDSKRPRVHPYGSSAELCKRLRQMKEASWKYYIVQKEIHPAMLVRSRKFVLRAHVLAWVSRGTMQLFLHDNPLVSENEAQFEFEASGRAWASQPESALVLQSGSRSAAYLLAESEELPLSLRDSILEQISSTVATVFQELHIQHPFPLDLQHHDSQYTQQQHPSDSSEGAMYQLYGLDFMLNSSGKVFLLEVNHSPRIATGAMGDVHGCYTELLMQAMQIMGVTEDASCEELPRPGKFGAWRDVFHATL